MKVVINALPYKPDSSGIGVMIRDLFGAFTRITDIPCTVILSNDSPEFPGKPTDIQIRTPFRHEQGLQRMLFQTFQMGRQYGRDAVFLTTDSKSPFLLPRSCRLVTLVTDLAVYRMPEVYQTSRVLLWRSQYEYLRRRADLFLTISEFTKQEMVSLLKIPPERIQVVPLACSDKMTREEDPQVLLALRRRYHLPEHYVLFVGNNNPRKNLKRLLQAFDALKETTVLPHFLVIAGEQGWKFDREQVIQGLKHPEAVRFIGYIPDEDMPSLYSAADLFVFPTLYEGFGIPILEAQRCGTPVVTSNMSSMPETAGEGALLVDPMNIESIRDGMRRALKNSDLAISMANRGRKNASKYAWIKSAALLNELLGCF